MSARRKPATPVEIVVLAPAWRRAIKDAVPLARRAVRAALKGAGHAGEPRSIAVALADDALLRDLNRRYRGKDRPTNVLSFEAGLPDRLGDIALALETLRAEARQQGKTLRAHFQHLLVHGALHLLGHDHERTAPAQRMEALEREILTGLGVGDPYAPRAAAGPRKSAEIRVMPKG